MKRPIKFVRVKLRGYSSYLTEKYNIYIKKIVIKLRCLFEDSILLKLYEILQLDFINDISKTKGRLIISLKSQKYISNLLKILSKYEILFIKQQEASLEDLFFQHNLSYNPKYKKRLTAIIL